MMEKICEDRLCTGCTACCNICPQGAIAMLENEEGFLYPKINGSLCNDCGLCKRTCPINAACATGESKSGRQGEVCDDTAGNTSGNESEQGMNKVYACFSNNPDIRSQSSSGGVFSQLALHVLSRNGAVFGAGFDSEFHIVHKYIENENGLDELRRSKYVQSNPLSTFREARTLLKEGRPVLYCGTPCQIAGLKAFLGREYDNLLTCDLACHGVPSPKVWGMFLEFLKDRYGSGIKSVSFRDKSTGWNNSSMKVAFENGRLYSDIVKREIFFIGFGKSIFNRNSCYDCKFRIGNTKADITLADFWGIDKQSNMDSDGKKENGSRNSGSAGAEGGFLDNKGVSLILTHTEAGEKAMSAIGDRIVMVPRGFEEAVRYNPRLISSVGEPAGRRAFFSDLSSGYGFDLLRRKYMDNFSIRYRIKTLAKLILGRG